MSSPNPEKNPELSQKQPEPATEDQNSELARNSHPPNGAPEAVAETAPTVEELDKIRKEIGETDRRLAEAIAALTQADKEARASAEKEAAFRAEAGARRREEEAARQQAEEKATRRRSEDDRNLAVVQRVRQQADAEAQRLGEEEQQLRIQAGNLRQAAGEMVRKRAESEVKEFVAAVEARRLEAEKSLRIAEERYNAELKRLRTEEEALHRATEETTARRIEVEAERHEAETQARSLVEEIKRLAAAKAARDAEADRLSEATVQVRKEQEALHQQVETLNRVNEDVAIRRMEIEAERLNAASEIEQLKVAQERIRATEKIRREAEVERLQLEAELSEQLEREQRLLAEIRRRAASEHERVEEASRHRAEEQDRHLADLQALRTEMEKEAERRAERERQLNSEIEDLRAAEREALTRIGQVESLRNRAEETRHAAAEKMQRIEAEARSRTVEVQRVLDRLEETRRNLDLEAHARAELEEHLKKEIEELRRLEIEEHNRIAELSRSRAELESRLQRERERLKLEEQAHATVASQIESLLEQSHAVAAAAEQKDDRDQNPPLAKQAPVSEHPLESASLESGHTSEVTRPGHDSTSSELFLRELKSPDPNRRITALGGLARHSDRAAFGLIAASFDDPSPEVRNAAARALRDCEPDRAVESFTRAIEEAPPERAQKIGVAIATSGLAAEALQSLSVESREDTYKALSLLFVMAKTGEITPLVQAVEQNPDPDVCGAAIKLLNLSGQSVAAESALQRRAERGL